jgi:hypothetical protein
MTPKELEEYATDARRAATYAVLQWLEEYCGKEVADFWAWERTPMPVGLPSDEQLEEGMNMAVKRVRFEKTHEEMMMEVRAAGAILHA